MTGRSRRREIRLLTVAVTWIVLVLRAVSRCLPYRAGAGLGAWLGRAAFVVSPRYRNMTEAHLAQAFPGKGTDWVRGTARRVFIHLGRSLMEIFLIRPERIDRFVEFRGAEILKNILSEGRGAIFVTGHIGNWELLASAVASRFPLSTVAAPLKSDAVNDMLISLRSRSGFRIIQRGRPGATKELIRAFRENRILGILIDQDTDVEGAFVNFFGRPAWTPTAAVQMAVKFNAPLVFGYIRRGPDGRHTAFIEGPISLSRSGNEEQDIVANTAMLTRKIEECILAQPDQWVWMHRRWRRQP